MEQPDLAEYGLDGILAVTGDLLNQASGLRNLPSPPPQATPQQVHYQLVLCRSQLDRLEVVLGQAMDLKYATAMSAARYQQIADDAWDEKADRARKQGLRDQYEGAQERYATWRLQTRNERLDARSARAAAEAAAHCEAQVRRMYRGLDSARLDLHKRLGALAFESSLERA